MMANDDEIACCLLRDAMNFRNPACRLTGKHSVARKWYYSLAVRTLLGIVCMLLLILPFSEHQHSFSSSPVYDIRDETIPESYMKYFYIFIPIEGGCLIIITASCIIRCYLVFPNGLGQFRKLYWTSPLSSTYRSEFHLVILYILALAVTWFVWVASIILYCIDGHTLDQHHLLLTRQLLRPLFLIVHIHMTRKVIKAITLSFIPMLRVILLLSLVIFLFALIGVILFEAVADNIYFSSIQAAYWSLLVYLTSSNSPDVLKSAYNESRLYFVYFGAYFLFCNQFILNVLEVLLAAKFVFALKKSVKRSYKNRLINLRNAFKKLDNSSGVVTMDVVNKAFNKLNWVKSYQQDEQSDNLNWPKFKKLCIDQFKTSSSFTTAERSNANDGEYLNWPGIDQCKKCFRTDNGTNKLKQHCVSFQQFINLWSAVVALTHVIVVTVFIAIEDKNSLIIVTLVFSLAFIPETIIRIFITPLFYFNFSFACKLQEVYVLCCGSGLFANFSARDVCSFIAHYLIFKSIIVYVVYGLDLVALLFASGVGFVHVNCLSRDKDCLTEDILLIFQITNILVLFRFLLIVMISKIFSDIIHTLLHAVLLLMPLAILAYILYYIFAVTGIFLFQTATPALNLTEKTSAECGTYEQLRYHSFHFQDFGSALVTMWNLMLVNNWFIIVEAFVKATSVHFGIFFVIWWILTETILKGIFFGTLLYVIERAFSESENRDYEADTKNFCQKLKQTLMEAIGSSSHTSTKNNYGFKSLISTSSIYYVKDLDEASIREVEGEMGGNLDDYIHPDFQPCSVG